MIFDQKPLLSLVMQSDRGMEKDERRAVFDFLSACFTDLVIKRHRSNESGGYLMDAEGSPVFSTQLSFRRSFRQQQEGLVKHLSRHQTTSQGYLRRVCCRYADGDVAQYHIVAAAYHWFLLVALICLFFFPISIPYTRVQHLRTAFLLVGLFLLWPPQALSDNKADFHINDGADLEEEAMYWLSNGRSDYALSRLKRLRQPIINQGLSRVTFNLGRTSTGQLHVAYRYFKRAEFGLILKQR